MARSGLRYIGKTQYKGVAEETKDGKTFFIARKTHKGIRWMKICETEKEAAKAYDIRLIELGLQPVNILKPKQNNG